MASPYGETPIGLGSKIMNLGEILTRRQGLHVPRYQRPYSWADNEVRRLIQDLRRAFKRRATFYFIGQIVFVKASRDSLEISDGQQRLATLSMIIAHVRDRLPGRARHYQGLIMDGQRPRLNLRRDDTSHFRAFVQEQGQMSALARRTEHRSDSRELMTVAARTIEEELSDEDRDLDAFMSYVVRCATFNVVDADERGCAATVYNTVNTTGLELSAADNIKCDLLENSKLSEAQADKAAQTWENLEDLLGRDRFCTLLNMTPYLLTGEELVSPGDLVAFRSAVDAAGGVPTFLNEKLPKFVYALRDIFHENVNVGPASADVNRRIKAMKQVGWRWAPAAIAFLAEHGKEHDRAGAFFRALDRLTFGCELSIIESRHQDSLFANALRFVGNDKMLYAPEQPNQRHVRRGGAGPLSLTKAEVDRFLAKLEKPPSHAKPRRRLLLRLEAAMPGGSMLSVSDDAYVEHVLPRGSAPEWEAKFPDPARRAEFANLLGNMLLITQAQNTEADNKGYPKKHNVYFKTNGAPVHALTRDVEGIDDWTFDVIGARQDRLVRILSGDWDLIPGTGAEF